jgi:hypothetical protein
MSGYGESSSTKTPEKATSARMAPTAGHGGQSITSARCGTSMRPTKAAIDAIREAYMADVLTIRAHILALNDPHLEDAWAGIETFAAVALRVMAKTNPSKLKSEMVTVGISVLL